MIIDGPKQINTFHIKFIDLCDRVLPFLSSAEQSVAIQIFSRTYGCNKKSENISHDTLIYLTNLTRPSLTKALAKLKQKNIIRELIGPSRRKPTTYEFIWPIVFSGVKTSPHKGLKTPFPVRRLPADFPVADKMFDVEQSKPARTSILDKLTVEGLKLIESIYNSMDESEKRRYRIEATRSPAGNSSVDIRIKELIAEREIGIHRMAKYKKWE